MFLRRNKPPIHHRVSHMIWPRSGWRRAMKYMMHRLHRLPGSTYSLAAGFACGAALSFTPFVGLHFVLAAIVAIIIGGNVVASAIGTVVGNPWTFPFIWISVHNVGNWILGRGIDEASAESLDFVVLFTRLLEAFLRLDLAYIWETLWPVWSPMIVGSLPIGLLVWFVTYGIVYQVIASYRRVRAQRRRRKKTVRNLKAQSQ